MEIDLQKLGLTAESTFAEIQTRLSGLVVFSEEENTQARNDAAAGARSASEAKYNAKLAKASKLSDEDAKILKDAKSELQFKELRKDETLAKFNDKDFKLIVKAEGLANLEGDERAAAIKGIATEYADKMGNGLPKPFNKPGEKDTQVEDKPYVPGSLGLMIDNEK